MEEVLPGIVSPGDSDGNMSLKEEGTPPLSMNSGRSSPPPDCAICLSRCRNKCFTDSCLHQFCFNCLLTWSKIKAECPLCKQPFKSIIHNVLSNDQYEEYLVEQEQQLQADDVISLSDLDVFFEAPRFRYTTTLTLHRRESLAIQRLLMRYPIVPALPAAPAPLPSHHRCQTLFRRSIYRFNLSARPLPDITGRYRDCSALFYRNNPAQMHRLVPWLKRELSMVVDDRDEAGQTRLLAFIMERLPRHDILSPQMERCLTPYLHNHTRHFLHELGCFASSPFDMVGYDRAVAYEPSNHRPPAPPIPVTETVSDTDSDIVLLSPGGPPAPGPSRSRRTLDSVVAIRTVSPSDSDSSSDGVVMVGYAAPPGARTPEVVDLLASDSDAVLVEEPTAPPSPRPSSSGLVKVSLKRNRPRPRIPVSDDESDSSPCTKRTRRIRPPRRARFVSRGSASTECTDRDTDSSSSTSSSSPTSDSSEGRSDGPNTRRAKRVYGKPGRLTEVSGRHYGSSVRRRDRFEARSKTRRALSSDTDDSEQADSKGHSNLRNRSPDPSIVPALSTLLDAVSESVLSLNNPVLSVNRRAGSTPQSTPLDLISPAVSSLLNEIDYDFFNQPGTSSRSLPFDSETKPLYFSIKKEEKE